MLKVMLYSALVRLLYQTDYIKQVLRRSKSDTGGTSSPVTDSAYIFSEFLGVIQISDGEIYKYH